MRILREVRSDRVVVTERLPTVAASLAAVPFAVMLGVAWVGTPTWAGGRPLVTLTLGAVVLFLASLALRRDRATVVPRGAELRWGDGVETDDPFRVTLIDGGQQRLLLSHRDPAMLLEQARKVADATGARLVLPAELADLAVARAQERKAIVPAGTLHIAGTAWNAQQRAAQATLSAGVFVFIVFLVSARAESGLSTLSVGLPLVSIAFALIVGAALVSRRLHVSFDPQRVTATRVLWGFRRTMFDAPSERVLSLRTVGHRRFLSTHLLIETTDGLRALRLAAEAATRAVLHWHPEREAFARAGSHGERLETSGVMP